ncbi:MAG: site-2 protease family protein [Betaproteobacteria bacterium]|nr:site-2 protease family protein [Betaproteobacteria bacterium]
MNQLIQTIAIYALPVLFAITLHEAAHGYVARHFGDMTAYAQRRISLNPLRHVDPVGTLLVPLVILLLSGGRFLFGWAKPIPVNYSALRKPKQHMAWVAAAGPLANLAMALGWALLLKAGLVLPESSYSEPMVRMAEAGVRVNLIFMFLNLLPILPLDGGRILASLLPNRLSWQYAKLEPFGLPVLLVLAVTNLLDAVLSPLLVVSESLIHSFVFI